MRVVAGSARGLKLVPPDGDRVRPTLDRVREALFNIIGPDLPGAAFLDLYAGSGANGIEALSRGAARAVFVDNHPESQACIRKNLASTKLEERGQLTRNRLPEEMGRIGGTYDVIFADPPYNFTDYEALLVGIDRAGLLAAGGRVILEHASKQDLPERAGRLERVRERRYGKTTLAFYA